MSMLQKYFFSLITLGLLCVFALLLYRDPFSTRSLVSNFAPFPDSFHYVVPARSFLSGKGFFLAREGGKVIPEVPFLYIVALIPAYMVNNDPRMFFYMNVVFAFISAFIFLKILSRVTANGWIRAFIFFLYVTNYFFYWFPELAMAENLFLPLFLLSIYLFLIPVTKKSCVLAAFLALSLYMTKYAALPMVGIYALSYFANILRHLKHTAHKKVLAQNLVFFSALITAAVISASAEQALYGRSMVSQVMNMGKPIFAYVERVSATLKHAKSAVSSQAVQQSSSASSWFSLAYVPSNFRDYWKSLHGYSFQFLWDFTPLVPQSIAALGLLGIFWSWLYPKTRMFGLTLVGLLFGQLLFMSTFYAADNRYIFHAIPTLLIGTSLSLSFIDQALSHSTHPFFRNIFYVGLMLLFTYYVGTHAMIWRKRIAINFKYAETSWWYVSVLNDNAFIAQRSRESGDKKPVLISPIPAYFIDFYSNNLYTLLPLATQQEFRGKFANVYGPNNYTDMSALYTKYLEEGNDLYLADYGLGNDSTLRAAFDDAKNNFVLTKLQSGCYDLCNIYQVTTK